MTANPLPTPLAADAEELSNLDVWSRCAPIRLAGYEEDLEDPHILPGVD